MDVIEFVESPHKLNFKTLYPVQKFILKAAYNVPLEDKARCLQVPKSWHYVNSPKVEHYYHFTEVEYMQYLYNEGRCNIKELDHSRQSLVFPLGRQSGKSLLSSIISSYEIYRLLREGNPQRHYGLVEGAHITVTTITGSPYHRNLLSKGIRDFFQCDFFKAHMSHDTQSYVKFQTLYDLDKTGRGGDSSIGISFLSSTPHGIGTNLVAILDEPAYFRNEDDVYQAVSVGGRTISISTPRNKVGGFYDKYELSKDAEDILMIQAPTWEVNPHIPLDVFKRAHTTLDPFQFASEFGAEFTSYLPKWDDPTQPMRRY